MTDVLLGFIAIGVGLVALGIHHCADALHAMARVQRRRSRSESE